MKKKKNHLILQSRNEKKSLIISEKKKVLMYWETDSSCFLVICDWTENNHQKGKTVKRNRMDFEINEAFNVFQVLLSYREQLKPDIEGSYNWCFLMTRLSENSFLFAFHSLHKSSSEFKNRKMFYIYPATLCLKR